jgi:pSer/pThr/pTyr-binding forkhead associated (FHA) protein/S1-C subfamily serine protease
MTFSGRRRLGVLGVAAAALVLATGAAAQDTTTTATQQDVVPPLVQPSIVYLGLDWSAPVYDSNPPVGYLGSGEAVAQAAYQCSGFFVSPNGHVMTASHCTEFSADVRDTLLDSAAVWAYQHHYFSGNPTFGQVRQYARRYFRIRNQQLTPTVVWSYAADGSDPKHLPARQLGNRAFLKGDVALLKVDADHTIPLPISTAPVSVGTHIDSVGFPGLVDNVTDADRVNPSFKDGEISSKKTIEQGLQDVYEVSAAIAHGMSGGPTVDSQGQVIGVNSFGASANTEQFNFISPSSFVDELLKDKGVQPRDSEDAKLLREGITATIEGNRNDALDALNQVVDTEPDWKVASTYRAQALALPEESSGLSWWVIVLIAAGAAALIAGAVLFFRRRRAARPYDDPGTAGGPARTVPPPAPQPTPAPGSATRIVSAAGPAAGEAVAFLTVGSGPRAGERIPVSGELSIGRESGDIVIADDEASRRHAAIRVAAAGLEIEDLGSSNGTFVNDRRVEGTQALSDGDEIRIGQTTIAVEIPQPEPARDATATLVVTSGPRAGERVPISGQMTVGRENADLVFEDAELSRRHALLTAAGGTVEISDEGSANGTFVNDRRIDGATSLNDGDSIRVGTTTFAVEVAHAGQRTTVSPAAPSATIIAGPEDGGATPER